MTFAANINFDNIDVLGGTGLESFTAGALNRNDLIFRMNVGLQLSHLSVLIALLLRYYIIFYPLSQLIFKDYINLLFFFDRKITCKKVGVGL